MTTRYIMLFKTLFCISFFGLTLFYSQKVSAATNVLILTEIYYNAATDTSEWLEFYNDSDEEIILANYRLSSDNDADFTFEPGAKIGPKQFIIIAADETKFQNIYNFPPDFTGLSLRLGNTSDFVVVKNESGEIIDGAAWGDNTYDIEGMKAAKQGHSIERLSLSEPFSPDTEKAFIENNCPSPGRYFPSEIFDDNLRIKSLYPAPKEGEEEFIEIENLGNKAADLFCWSIADLADGYYFKEHSVISQGSSVRVYQPTSKISLNDLGDTISLYSPNGKLVHTISYPSSTAGDIITESTLEQQQTANEVKNLPGEAKNDEIAAIKEQDNGTAVKVIGIVTAAPGDLADNYFYIQDEGSGIQIYSYYGKFPILRSGDKIQVSGELSSTNGEKRIKIKDVSDIIIFESQTPPPALPLTIPEVGEKYEGAYIKTRGKVIKKDQNSITISALGGEIKVIDRRSRLNFKSIKKNSYVELSGIVSEYRGDYRILPFREEDVKITSSGTLPRAGSEPYFIYIILPLFLYKLLCILHRKINLKQWTSPVL